MDLHRLSLLAGLFSASLALGADPVAVSDVTVRQAMEKATRYMMSISTHGGYVYKYSPDLSDRYGEQEAGPLQIWIQPPGTPTMGMAFLRAYASTRASLYLDAAHGAALALAGVQLASGGWHYSGNFDPKYPNKDGVLSLQGVKAIHGKHPNNQQYRVATTYDDDTDQSAIRFLMAYVDAAKGSNEPDADLIQKALDTSLQGMIRAQYPNGAWPQRYYGRPRSATDYAIIPASIPKDYPKKWPDVDYGEFYTTNDNSQRNCIFVMFEAYHRYGKPEYLASALRGADFLLLAQLPEPQPAWAQQYNFQMQPAWARAFEPPAVVSSESCGVVNALLEVYLETGNKKYLDAIAPAAAWFRRSTVAPETWSRFYELGTNKPIYGSLDGNIYYDIKDAKPGYNWQNSFKIPETLAKYEEIKSIGREAYLKAHPEPASAMAAKDKDNHNAAKHARQALQKMDDQGRWITMESGRKFDPVKPYFTTESYLAAMNDFCNYLQAKGQ